MRFLPTFAQGAYHALNWYCCKNAKPSDKPTKISDGKGLYLLVHPNGSKYW
jgi:hypothetical protein